MKVFALPSSLLLTFAVSALTFATGCSGVDGSEDPSSANASVAPVEKAPSVGTEPSPGALLRPICNTRCRTPSGEDVPPADPAPSDTEHN